MHFTLFALQKVRSLTPLLSLLPDWEGNATVSVFYNFENHHILKVTCSSLQSVEDRTFCIADTQTIFCHAKSSVFNTCAESSAGLGRNSHCLCILQFWEPSHSKSDSSSLQSAGDRTFCIGQTQSSVFNIGAESYAEGASGQPATTTTTATAATTGYVWVELQKHSKALILSL